MLATQTFTSIVGVRYLGRMENQKASRMIQSLRGLERSRLESKANRTQRPPSTIFLERDRASDLVEDWEFIPTGTNSLVFKTCFFEVRF